jgi:hypothetical protein
MSHDDPVAVFSGPQAEAEVLHAMLRARGINSNVTRDREVEGGTALVEAVIFVAAEQADEARVLIANARASRP